MRLLFSALIGLSLLPAAGSTQDIDKEELTRIVQKDNRDLQAAVYGGNVDTVLRYAYPAIIDSMGGYGAARVTLAKSLGQIQQMGMQLKIMEFPAPPDFVPGRNRLFAVVPTRSIIAAGNDTVESFDFQLGIQDPDTGKWTYFEGSSVTDDIRQTLFPDFPAAYEFPTVSRKRL